jgi:long-chain fatty acid transport protein
LGYRSRVAHHLDVDADFTLDRAGLGRSLRAETGAFEDAAGGAGLTTPATASLGVFRRVTPAWAVMGELQVTSWSDFDTLRVAFDNPAQPDAVTAEDWTDSWFAAAGVRYRPSDRWRLRAGIAFDQSPIPDETRTPRVPGGDRTWLSLGASYRPVAGVVVRAGYTHIRVEDTSVRLEASDPGNALRGDLDVDYRNAIDLLSLQATVRF